SRFFIEFFDFTDSLMVVPAVENENVTITNGSHESVVILRAIAIGGQQNAERFWINDSCADWCGGNLVMRIGIKRRGICEVTHRLIFGNQQNIGIRVRDSLENIRVERFSCSDDR